MAVQTCWLSFIVFVNYVCGQHIFPNGTRNKYVWPFASDSIWNHPIGSNATYVDAGIVAPQYMATDPDYWIITTSNDPKIDWYQPHSWNQRCDISGQYEYPYKVSFPQSLIVPDAHSGSTPNYAAAILLPDGTNIVQVEPLCRDSSGGPMFGYSTPGQDPSSNNWTSIYSEGYYGGHFGSGLSSIGGTIRMGELMPGAGPIQHALKWELYGQQYFYNDGNENDCKRWPAILCDSCWKSCYGGKNPNLRMGSLLAIDPSDFNALNESLKTEPGRMMLKVLTDYGAYIVDNTGWNEQQYCVEVGVTDQFKKAWGYAMDNFGSDSGSPYVSDIIEIAKKFKIVNNNGPNSIGGGGTLRQPLPPKIGN